MLVLGVGLVGLRRSPAVTFATLMAVSVAMLAASYVLFANYGVWLSPLLPILAAAVLFIVQTAVGFLTERQRAQETKRAFAQYVPAEVVNRLIEQPELLELGGEERELTLLFADLRELHHHVREVGAACRRRSAGQILRRHEHGDLPPRRDGRQVHRRRHHGVLGCAAAG